MGTLFFESDGVVRMATQTDFDGTKEYFDKEMNKLIAEQYKPLCRWQDIPRVELPDVKVDTTSIEYDPLADDEGVVPTIMRTIEKEMSVTFSLEKSVDPMTLALLSGFPVRVMPKDMCCQPLTAVPAKPHKKKRICKKWLKKYGWKIVYGPEKAWIFKDPVRGDILCVGPDTYKALREASVDAENVAVND